MDGVDDNTGMTDLQIIYKRLSTRRRSSIRVCPWWTSVEYHKTDTCTTDLR